MKFSLSFHLLVIFIACSIVLQLMLKTAGLYSAPLINR